MPTFLNSTSLRKTLPCADCASASMEAMFLTQNTALLELLFSALTSKIELAGDALSAIARVFLLFQMLCVLPLILYIVRAQLSFAILGTVYPG